MTLGRVMPELRMCAACRTAMIDLLEQRIRKILEVAEQERTEDNEYDDEPEAVMHAKSHCFHLVELQAILRGQQTCGVFDDHGPPPTVKGRRS